ncbi:MAG: cytochrome c [Bacteroidia bacterium]|nr:cytochrome c [Bacteroidia bacterium]
MKLHYLFMISFATVLLHSCGGNSNTGVENENTATEATETGQTENPSYDPNRGVGKFTDVQVSDKLDGKLADEGQKVYDVKCSSCHKLSGEKLVGPGWEGVTKRFSAAWIMNFITNTDEMLNKDPKAQAQLEICLVRMPNQNLSDQEAKALYEFMRKNDGVK